MKETRFEEVKLPAGFRFADLASEFAYRHAVAGTRGVMGRLPVVIINSTMPAVGKTTLARQILEERLGKEARVALACEAEILPVAFPKAIKNGYLWLDDVRSDVLQSTDLLIFASCQCWMYRPLQEPEPVEVEIPEDFQIILTGLRMKLPADLARRALVINLEPR